MKNHLLILILLTQATLLTAQHETGFRLSVLANKVNDSDSKSDKYRWRPAAPGAALLVAWQLHYDWYLQTELGYAQRNTVYSSSGVSHQITNDYQLHLMEASLLGKYHLDIARPSIRLVFGLTAGYAISGMLHRYGHSVSPSTFNFRESVDFEYFYLRRFQYGPVFGVEVLQRVFRAGALAFEMRYAYYPEKYQSKRDNPNETRYMFGLGYRWLFGKPKVRMLDARHLGKK